MATLGEKLKAAREKAGYTTSQAAEATRIKIQHIEELERDDFTRFAAPIYGKGFIKLYAEFLNLDPSPLLAEYALAGKSTQDPTLKAQKGTRPKDSSVSTAAPARRAAPPQDKGGLLFDMNGKPSADVAGRGNERVAAPKSIGERVAGVAAVVRQQVSALKPAARASEPAVRSSVSPAVAPFSGAPAPAVSAPADQTVSGARDGLPAKSDGAAAEQGRASRNVALVVGVTLIVILLISGVTRCVRGLLTHGEKGRAAAGDAPMVLTQEPPEPYSD